MDVSDLMHGADWDGRDLAGWYASEKIDGYRVFWDGRALRTRGGIEIEIPAEWRAGLRPDTVLDGELHDHVAGMRAAGLAATYGRFSPGTRLMVFDAPGPGALVDRIEEARRAVEGLPFAIALNHARLIDTQEAIATLRAVKVRGGEGIVVRHPDLRYVAGRTTSMLKLKEVPA